MKATTGMLFWLSLALATKTDEKRMKPLFSLLGEGGERQESDRNFNQQQKHGFIYLLLFYSTHNYLTVVFV